jgi:hypothetical protein
MAKMIFQGTSENSRRIVQPETHSRTETTSERNRRRRQPLMPFCFME